MAPVTKLRILGWLHVLLGGLGSAFGLVLLFLVATSTDRGSNAGVVVVPLVLFFGAVFFLPAFVGGVGLLRRRRWARGLLIVLSVVELLAVPIGTVIGAFGLWVLFGRETGQLLSTARASDGSPPLASAVPGFIAERAAALLVVAGVGAAFIIVIGAGFRISGDPAPAGITALFYPAVIALPVIVVVAVRLIAAQRRREREQGVVPLRVQIDNYGNRRVPFDADHR